MSSIDNISYSGCSDCDTNCDCDYDCICCTDSEENDTENDELVEIIQDYKKVPKYSLCNIINYSFLFCIFLIIFLQCYINERKT